MSMIKCPECKSENYADPDCPSCDGTGWAGEHTDEPCHECDGDGYVEGGRECLDCGAMYE